MEFIRRQPRWRLVAAAAALVVFAGWLVFGGGKKAATGTAFTARRGNLPIIVTEGGSVEAIESQVSRSEVKGYQGTKILKIVEEGYLVTEDDVRTNKVLVELDSSEIKQKIVQQDIQFQSTLASLTEAQQAFEIQVNQNISDIKAAEQKARFARMDLEKFLGDTLTQQLLAEIGLKEETNSLDLAALEAAARMDPPPAPTNSPPADAAPGTNAPPPGGTPPAPPLLAAAAPATNKPIQLIDFTKYAQVDLLGDGSAKQQLRKQQDDLLVAQKEERLARSNLEGTERLFQKGFVTKTDRERESLATDQNILKVKTAQTAYDLFIKYEFPKQAEENYSKYEEALRALERSRKEAVSKLAQARARLKSAEGRYQIEADQRKELNDQFGKCLIRAKKTGLVVYGSGGERFYWNEEQIREGATVREQQPILTIPDMTQMSVKVKIHESHIKKIQKGMKATIRIEAFPDEKLTGEVNKVGLLPDSQNRWMNPDMKVYVTVITIEGVHDWLKPGMGAKVEIQVKELSDVVYVPVQAVSPENGDRVCYSPSAGKPKRRVVEVGDFNDEFIEIKNGLKEGDRVFLRAPEGVATPETAVAGGPAKGKAKPPAAKPVAPSPGPAATPRAAN